jgi:predicted RNA-binding Zn-ribbon protein involved in translation (DUF1610 family)
MGHNFKMKRCPVCNSTQTRENESEFRCCRCGYKLIKDKQLKLFNET